MRKKASINDSRTRQKHLPSVLFLGEDLTVVMGGKKFTTKNHRKNAYGFEISIPGFWVRFLKKRLTNKIIIQVNSKKNNTKQQKKQHYYIGMTIRKT